MAAQNRIQKVEAVIITHREYGEADRILRAFTPDLGKISLLAKGVRKTSSRKAAHIEPFTYSSLVLAKGQNFWILTQADTIRQFTKIQESLYRTGLAAYILELADRLTVDDQPDATVFRLLIDALHQINISEDAFIPAIYYELQLLNLTGFRPELFQCVSCSRKIIKEDQFFSIEQGGVVCPACRELQPNLLPASQEVLKYLRHFQRSSYSIIEQIRINPELKREIRKILDPYVSAVIERKMNSPVFIQQISELDSPSK